MDSGVPFDIDGEDRPQGRDYDLGFDEFPLAVTVIKLGYPDPVAVGGQLAYTLTVINTSDVTHSVLISDILPSQITPTGVLTWSANIAPDEVWIRTLSTMVLPGSLEPLDNVLIVKLDDGQTGSYTCTVTVEEPITGLYGYNDSPTTIGNPTFLTATVTAGSNVSFTWNLGDGTYGSGVAVTHTYPATGLYTAVVTASNPVSVLTATTIVTVSDEPIAGLSAVNDSPTTLGDPTTLGATLTAGSNISFTWDLGDGTSGTGSLLTHTYPAAGIYTALVTASNSISFLIATTTVLVEEAIVGLEAFNDSPTVLGATTTLTATLTAGSNVRFTWAFGDGSFGTGPVLTHTYPAALSYTAVVTATNSVSAMVATTVVTVTKPVLPTCCIFLPLVLRGY